jgi:hypothetical protein
LCLFCKEFHRLAANGDLPTCELRLSLLTTSPQEIYRGKTVQNLKENLKSIRQNVTELKFVLTNGTLHIQEYFADLRDQVKINTTRLIDKLKQLHDAYNEKINKFEEHRIAQFQNKNNNETLKNINVALNEINEFEIKWESYLKNSELNEEEMINAIHLSLDHIKLLNGLRNNQNELIFDAYYQIKYNECIEPAFGSFEFQINLENLNCINLNEIIFDFKKTPKEYSQNSYIDYLGIDTYFAAYQNEKEFLKFCILYINNQDEIVVKAVFEHEKNLTLLNHFITNHKKNLILVDYGYDFDLFRVFDEQLQIKNEIKLKNMELKGANDNYIYLISSDLNDCPVHIYDWNFNLVKTIGQRYYSNQPFYFPTTSSSDEKYGLWQLENCCEKYYWLNENFLYIMDEITGFLIKKLNISATKFQIDSKNNLIVNTDYNKIKYFNLNGELINQLVILNLSGSSFDFILDKNDSISFNDLNEFNLYQLKNVDDLFKF